MIPERTDLLRVHSLQPCGDGDAPQLHLEEQTLTLNLRTRVYQLILV